MNNFDFTYIVINYISYYIKIKDKFNCVNKIFSISRLINDKGDRDFRNVEEILQSALIILYYIYVTSTIEIDAERNT